MAQVSQLSPELASGVLQLARVLLAAARNWTLYPREHPAVGPSVARLSDAVRQTSGGAIFSLAVTPDTLLVEGAPADRAQMGIAEAAALLHDRDIIQITFNTWERDNRGEHVRVVVEAVHPEPLGIDPLQYL